MSDAKTEYAMAVIEIKRRAETDEELARKVQDSYLERRRFVENWVKANINDVVAEIAPGAHAQISGRKVYFFNEDRSMVVVADVSGYLRVAQLLLRKKGNKFHYVDLHGRSADYYTDENGKQHGRDPAVKRQYTHYRIKHRDEM